MLLERKPILLSFLGFLVRIWPLGRQSRQLLSCGPTHCFLGDPDPWPQGSPGNSKYAPHTDIYRTHTTMYQMPVLPCPACWHSLSSANGLLASRARPLPCLSTEQGVTPSLWPQLRPESPRKQTQARPYLRRAQLFDIHLLPPKHCTSAPATGHHIHQVTHSTLGRPSVTCFQMPLCF